MAGQTIDYDSLAQQHGGMPDYDTLAAKYGGTGNSPASTDQPAQVENPEGLLGGAWRNLDPTEAIKFAMKIAPGSPFAPAAFRDAAAAALEAHKDQFQKAKDAFSKGRYSEAIGHTLATALPLLGPMAAHVAETAGGTEPQFDKFGNVVQPGMKPDIPGAVGEGIGLGAQLLTPEAVRRAGPIATAVADRAPQVAAAAKDAGVAVLQNLSITHPLRVIPATLRAAVDAWKAASPEAKAGAARTTYLDAVARETTGKPFSRLNYQQQGQVSAYADQLPDIARREMEGPQPVTSPPASGISAATQAGPPAEDTELLDAIAQSQAGKPFAKLGPAHQATVRDIASKFNSGAAPEAAAPSGPATSGAERIVSPTAPKSTEPIPITRGKTIFDIAREELAPQTAQAAPQPVQPPPEVTAGLNSGVQQGSFLRNYDLDKIARTVRSELNKGGITKAQAEQIISSPAGVESLRQQLGIPRGRYADSMATYLRGKVFQ